MAVRDLAWARRITELLRVRGTSFRESYERLQQIMAEAHDGRAWEFLGYPSWTAYVADVFKDEPMLLQRDAQRSMAQLMSAEGMSTRAVAQVLGTSAATVYRDVSGVSFETPTPEPVSSGSTVATSERVVIAETRHVDITPEPSPTPTPAPRKVTGLDGKTYTPPTQKETKPRRNPLPEQFFRARYDLTKKVESLERLTADDRFNNNKEKVAQENLNDLTRAIETLQRIMAALQN